jgi:putative Mg2+ transporter-C (MgtC) family protein
LEKGGILETWDLTWQLTPWHELDVVLQLLIAALLGGVIGYERERAEKPAGFRTHLLVCVGAALFTIASIHGFAGNADPSRVAAGVVVGMGFLGAGTIIRGGRGVVGLTTAATMWAVAAIGLTIGTRLYLAAIVVSILVLVALRLQKWMSLEDDEGTEDTPAPKSEG